MTDHWIHYTCPECGITIDTTRDPMPDGTGAKLPRVCPSCSHDLRAVEVAAAKERPVTPSIMVEFEHGSEAAVEAAIGNVGEWWESHQGEGPIVYFDGVPRSIIDEKLKAAGVLPVNVKDLNSTTHPTYWAIHWSDEEWIERCKGELEEGHIWCVVIDHRLFQVFSTLEKACGYADRWNRDAAFEDTPNYVEVDTVEVDPTYER